MNVLLVKLFTEARIVSPPLGLLYISSYLKSRFPAASVKLLDMRLDRDWKSALEKQFDSWKPALIGISSFTGDLPVLSEFTRAAKKVFPEAHICCGGPYPTQSPEDFDGLDKVDSIISGEGEESFSKLYEMLLGGAAGKDVPRGIALRGGGNSFSGLEKSPYIENIDALPAPDCSIIDLDRYARSPQMNGVLMGKRYMPVFTSRACPFRCTYCHNIFGKEVRLRSPENVVDEIETLYREQGVDEIQIFDDIFNFNRDRVMAICDLIIARNLKVSISFPNGLRGDMMDEEMILKLKEAGAYSITFAIETASERLQKLIGKNLNIEKTKRAIATASKHGLITRVFFMIGFPTETREEISRTINLAMRLPILAASFFIVVPFKGTELYELALREAGTAIKDSELPHFYTPDKSYYELATGTNLRIVQKNAYLRFYFNPLRLCRILVKIPQKWAYLRQLRGNFQNIFNYKRLSNLHPGI